jgi:hypothetical protein
MYQHGHDHAHLRGHGHSDGHAHAHRESDARVEGGAPVLDIGGDIGAMVATTPSRAAGTELHLRSEHEPPISIHTGVWERRVGADRVTAAVFAELVAGTYSVLDEGGDAMCQVKVRGGELTQIDLRD